MLIKYWISSHGTNRKYIIDNKFLRILQEQFLGFHLFIFCLNSSKEEEFLISIESEREFHIIAP